MPKSTTTPDPAQTSRTDSESADDVFDAAGTRAAVIAACDSLSPGPDKQLMIAAFASTMTHLARGAYGVAGTTPNRFRQIGRATSERELNDLARHARKVATLFERLHEPAILALADAGLFGTIRLGLPAELRLIADQCDAANVENMSIAGKRGPKENTRAIVLGRIAARAYVDLTGRDPTYTTDHISARTGPWPRFLKAVFQAMKMDGYGDHRVITLAAEQKGDTAPETVLHGP
jgi:hypothetical protein